MPPKIPMPDPTPAQEKFLLKLSRMIPEAFWATHISTQLYVGLIVESAGSRGLVRRLFFDHRKVGPKCVGVVVAWEDGSITVPMAVLEFLANEREG